MPENYRSKITDFSDLLPEFNSSIVFPNINPKYRLSQGTLFEQAFIERTKSKINTLRNSKVLKLEDELKKVMDKYDGNIIFVYKDGSNTKSLVLKSFAGPKFEDFEIVRENTGDNIKFPGGNVQTNQITGTFVDPIEWTGELIGLDATKIYDELLKLLMNKTPVKLIYQPENLNSSNGGQTTLEEFIVIVRKLAIKHRHLNYIKYSIKVEPHVDLKSTPITRDKRFEDLTTIVDGVVGAAEEGPGSTKSDKYAPSVEISEDNTKGKINPINEDELLANAEGRTWVDQNGNSVTKKMVKHGEEFGYIYIDNDGKKRWGHIKSVGNTFFNVKDTTINAPVKSEVVRVVRNDENFGNAVYLRALNYEETIDGVTTYVGDNVYIIGGLTDDQIQGLENKYRDYNVVRKGEEIFTTDDNNKVIITGQTVYNGPDTAPVIRVYDSSIVPRINDKGEIQDPLPGFETVIHQQGSTDINGNPLQNSKPFKISNYVLIDHNDAPKVIDFNETTEDFNTQRIKSLSKSDYETLKEELNNNTLTSSEKAYINDYIEYYKYTKYKDGTVWTKPVGFGQYIETVSTIDRKNLSIFGDEAKQKGSSVRYDTVNKINLVKLKTKIETGGFDFSAVEASKRYID